MPKCPHCGQQMPDVRRPGVTDAAIIEALKHPSPRTYGRSGPSKPWLYAAADNWDSRKADFSRWFVTGPDDRRGYIEGPFPHDQVERIAATGKLSPICYEDGKPIAYEMGR